MRHPPYHLRPNKAADRLLFCELLEIAATIVPMDSHIYYGLGGPFLMDFRVLGGVFPQMQMVSIEEEPHTLDRQRFHLPSRNVRLVHASLERFVDGAWPNGPDISRPMIVWADMTRLRHNDLNAIVRLISGAPASSIFKITLPAVPPDADGLDDLEQYAARALGDYSELPIDPDAFSRDSMWDTVLRAIRIAVERAVAGSEVQFKLLSAFKYQDGAPMVTVCGMICAPDDHTSLLHGFSRWEFLCKRWDRPQSLDLPDLSIKERLLLDALLPSPRGTGKALCRRLGYRIDQTNAKTIRKLDSYRRLYRAYPIYGRISM